MKQPIAKVFSWYLYIQRFILSIAAIALALQLVAAPANATGVYQIPSLTPGTWLIDQGEVLSRLSEGQISKALDDLAKNTGNEIKMVTIHRLDYGETATSFTNKLFEKWFPTPEAQANKILLVIDTLTNTTAIRTGDKVKNILPDEIAESVANETLTAPLRDGNKYNQALSDASDRLVAVLSGKPDPGPPQIIDKVNVESTYKSAEETDRGSATIWVVGLLIAATLIPMLTYFFYQGFSFK